MKPTVAPLPKEIVVHDSFSSLASMYLTCRYQNGEKCQDHIVENFQFFHNNMFARSSPYTVREYEAINLTDAVDNVFVIIETSKEDYDIVKLNESYSLVVSDKNITINAVNSFGASRAFATLMQLVDAHPKLPENKRAYCIYHAQIMDYASFSWREVLVDSSRHFLPLKTLKRQINALAISKFNVFHFHAIDADSYSLKFKEEPQAQLVKGAWAPYFYHSISDIKELAKYAFTRGVFFYVEMDFPGHCYSMGAADPKLISHCPKFRAENGNSIQIVPLNPVYEKTFSFVSGAVEETIAATFGAGSMKPIIHLGGDEVYRPCWEEDPDISAYMKEHNFDTRKLWHDFHDNLNNFISNLTNKNRYQVYWQESLENENNLDPESSIYHLWQGLWSVNKAVSKGLMIISSYNWYLDQQRPGGKEFYQYQDTWQAFYQQTLPWPKTIGGGVAQFSECIWDKNIDSHIWPRSLAVSEVLWSNPSSREIVRPIIDRFEHLSCMLYQTGIKSGSFDPYAPCLGYPER